jgi:hypothetical protein
MRGLSPISRLLLRNGSSYQPWPAEREGLLLQTGRIAPRAIRVGVPLDTAKTGFADRPGSCEFDNARAMPIGASFESVEDHAGSSKRYGSGSVR